MYHRFHAPADFRIERVTFISGDTWNVNPIALKRVERLFCKNERAVIETRLTSGECADAGAGRRQRLLEANQAATAPVGGEIVGDVTEGDERRGQRGSDRPGGEPARTHPHERQRDQVERHHATNPHAPPEVRPHEPHRQEQVTEREDSRRPAQPGDDARIPPSRGGRGRGLGGWRERAGRRGRDTRPR